DRAPKPLAGKPAGVLENVATGASLEDGTYVPIDARVINWLQAQYRKGLRPYPGTGMRDPDNPTLAAVLVRADALHQFLLTGGLPVAQTLDELELRGLIEHRAIETWNHRVVCY